MGQAAVVRRREGEADPCAGDETRKDGGVDKRDRGLVRTGERVLRGDGGAPTRRVECGRGRGHERVRRERRELEEVDRSEDEDYPARDGRDEVGPAIDCGEGMRQSMWLANE